MSDTKRSPIKSDDFRDCLCCKLGTFVWAVSGYDCHVCAHTGLLHYNTRALALTGQAYIRLFKGVFNHRDLVKRLVNMGLLSAEINSGDLAQSYQEVIDQSSFGEQSVKAFCDHFFGIHGGAGYSLDSIEKFGSLLSLPNERMSYAVQVDVTKRAHITLGIYVTLDAAVKHFIACKNASLDRQFPISVTPYHEKSYLVGGIPKELYFNIRPPHISFRHTSVEELNHFKSKGVNIKFGEAHIWCYGANRRLNFMD